MFVLCLHVRASLARESVNQRNAIRLLTVVATMSDRSLTLCAKPIQSDRSSLCLVQVEASGNERFRTRSLAHDTMNWMTSGRHRALSTRHARKKRLQMQLPAHVQRESERRRLQQQRRPTGHSSAPLPPSLALAVPMKEMPERSARRGRDDTADAPWYIVPVLDTDESQGMSSSHSRRLRQRCHRKRLMSSVCVTQTSTYSSLVERVHRRELLRRREPNRLI